MNILVRPLREPDLPLADRIFRLAFGTFNGLPDPLQYGGDLDKIRTRWLADPGAAFGAEVGGELVGSNFVTHWGSVGYFGPLTVHPDFWDRGVAQKLLEPALSVIRGLGLPPHRPLHLLAAAPSTWRSIRNSASGPGRSRPSCPRRSGRWRGEGRSAYYSQAPETRAPRAGGRRSRAHRRHLCRAGRAPGDSRPRGPGPGRHRAGLGRCRAGGLRARCTAAPAPRPGAAPGLSNSGRPGPDPG